MSAVDLSGDQTAADERLERRGGSARALYEHWERHQWSALEIDLRRDAASFGRLGPGERHGLLWIFAHRFHAEFHVARLLAPFLLAAPDWETQLLLATQTADEHRHLQLVLRVYDEVFGVGGGIEEVREIADRNMDIVAATLYTRLERQIEALDRDRHPDVFLKSVVAYHLLGEGVVARTAQNLAGPQYRAIGEFPGLELGQRLVARDEARHIGIGVSYCRLRLREDAEQARAVVAEAIEEFTELAAQLLGSAEDGMDSLVRSGYGVEPAGFYGEALRLLRLRLRSIGFLEAAR